MLDQTKRRSISVIPSLGLQKRRPAKLVLLQVMAFAALSLMVTARAEASYLNLTTAGASGVINGATFTQGSTGSGTGVFPAFVQVDGGGSPPVHEAYNTTANNTLDNGSSPTFNHEIRISDIPIFFIGGVAHYSFLLDINESAGGGDQYISLDELKVITSTSANQSTTPLPTGTLRYDMNSPGPGNGVLLDFSLGSGSGTGDMAFVVPVSFFAGSLSTDFVYLYSKFGVLGTLTAGNSFGAPAGNYANSDGFEEWAFGASNTSTVPEPSTYALYGLGVMMLFVSGWWQRRRKMVS